MLHTGIKKVLGDLLQARKFYYTTHHESINDSKDSMDLKIKKCSIMISYNFYIFTPISKLEAMIFTIHNC